MRWSETRWSRYISRKSRHSVVWKKAANNVPLVHIKILHVIASVWNKKVELAGGNEMERGEMRRSRYNSRKSRHPDQWPDEQRPTVHIKKTPVFIARWEKEARNDREEMRRDEMPYEYFLFNVPATYVSGAKTRHKSQCIIPWSSVASWCVVVTGTGVRKVFLFHNLASSCFN